ncbi:MAG: NAD-dependent epimerase/dehydratase family protein [Bacteroidetes bacterium]|nr:NAD-dependent epimerase/dehydratase family protein [Bacteroidota bacterium]
MVKILITGGAGFIGSSLAERFLSTGKYFIVVVDNLLTGSLKKIPNHANCRFIKCDVNNYNDISAIMTSYQFDFVFHYAAVVGVNRTIENPIMVLNDLQGIKNVLDLCKNTGVKRVFFSSSSEVYGEPVELPQHEETTPLNSRLPYAVVKNAGESFCKSYQKEYGLDYTIFRFFNTYGPKQSTDFVISKFIKAALKNQPITVYGSGNQTRTFCFVDDNTTCTLKILEEGHAINDVINIGSEMDITILELAELIIALTKSSSRIEFLPPLKEGDMTRRQPDSKKMKKIMDNDFISLEDGLKKILQSEMAFLY